MSKAIIVSDLTPLEMKEILYFHKNEIGCVNSPFRELKPLCYIFVEHANTLCKIKIWQHARAKIKCIWNTCTCTSFQIFLKYMVEREIFRINPDPLTIWPVIGIYRSGLHFIYTRSFPANEIVFIKQNTPLMNGVMK